MPHKCSAAERRCGISIIKATSVKKETTHQVRGDVWWLDFGGLFKQILLASKSQMGNEAEASQRA